MGLNRGKAGHILLWLPLGRGMENIRDTRGIRDTRDTRTALGWDWILLIDVCLFLQGDPSLSSSALPGGIMLGR